MKYSLISIFLVLFQIDSVFQALQSLKSGSSTNILLEETFAYPDGELPADWWSEGAKAIIKGGRLYVDANHTVSTVWLDKELSGNLRIEYDVHIESSNDNSNNMNCFFLYSDTTSSPLRDSKKLRSSGNYQLYHGYNGYIFTYVANRKEPAGGRFRLRDCPGFHLLQENYTYENKKGETYHIKIEKLNERIRFYVDGILMIDKRDNEQNPIHQSGLFGFRTYHTELWWDNLLITKL